MVKVKEDMTGWNMWEHGVPDSRLTVLEQAEDRIDSNGKHYARWKCMCNCENHTIKIIQQSHLKDGITLSCGCLGKEKRQTSITKHGKSNTRLYNIWQNMKTRCYSSHCEFYNDYGGRGIVMCDEWKNDFISFYTWAINNGYEEGATWEECSIDRIDVNGNYCPENCQWTDKFEQAINHRTQRNNTSGVRGVCWDSYHKKWCSRINVHNKRIHLGFFDSKEEAIKTRLQAEIKYYGKELSPQSKLFEQYKIKGE